MCRHATKEEDSRAGAAEQGQQRLQSRGSRAGAAEQGRQQSRGSRAGAAEQVQQGRGSIAEAAEQGSISAAAQHMRGSRRSGTKQEE